MKRLAKLLLTLSIMAITILLVSTVASAAPAMNDMAYLSQPSGETFTARQAGDEWFSFTFTETGDIVLQDADGYWCYAVADTDGIKASSARYIINAKPQGALTQADMNDIRDNKLDSLQNAPSMPGSMSIQQSLSLMQPTGTQKVLVLLVSFDVNNNGASDAGDTFIQNTDSAWNNAFFGTTGKTIANYYKEISGNQFTFAPAAETSGTANDGIVSIRLTRSHPNPGDQTDDRNRQIVADALAAANDYIDFSSFDTNINGVNGAIDTSELHIVTIVAGYERACGSAFTPSVWAHRWELDDPADMSHPVVAPLLDGVRLGDWKYDGGYTQLGEINFTHDTPDTYVTYMAPIGTTCHELGHDLGLPDLYDTTNASKGVGIHSLMGSGNWCQALGGLPGDTPSHLDAWSKIELGFVTPTVVTSKGNYNLNAVAVSGITYNVLKIPTSDANQYFLVENREYNGFDDGLYLYTQDGGIAIWHIDETVINAEYTTNSVNDDETHKGVDLEEANYAGYDSLNPKSQLDDNNSKQVIYDNYFRVMIDVNCRFSSASTPNSNLYAAGGPTYIDIYVQVNSSNVMRVDISVPNDATLRTGFLSDIEFSGSFAGGASIASSAELAVTIQDSRKINALLYLARGNEGSAIKYVNSAAQPANDAAYTGTSATGSITITVANGDVIWVLVTAPDGTTKRYYKVAVTVSPPITDATLSGGSLADVTLFGSTTGGANTASSSSLIVSIPDTSMINAALLLTKGNANATVKYIKGAQPANDAAYTGTYTAGSTNITVADGDVIWLLVTAEDGVTKLYYKIIVNVISSDATISAGTLAGATLSGTFTGGADTASSSALTVTIPDAAKANAALLLTKGNGSSTIKYVKGAQPANDAAYSGTYTSGSTSITVANGDVIWLLMTAENGTTKLYYKITVTVLPPSTIATISAGTLAGTALSGTFTGGADTASSSALTVSIPDAVKANAALLLTKGNANSTIKYVKGTQPANDAAYTGTYTSGSTSITVADSDVIWLLITAENGTTKLYYKITVTVIPPSTNATISAGTLAGTAISGTFTGGVSTAASTALAVTIPDVSQTNAALLLTKGNANAAVKYVKGTQPANDAAYTGTYTAGSTNITVADNDVIWLLVTAEDGITKLYYKITVNVVSTDATISGGTLAGTALSGTFTGGANTVSSSALTVTLSDSSKTNAALLLTKGNASATIKYLKGAQPGVDADYTGTYTAGSTNITVADGNIIWLLMTAENGTTKLYYKITVTVLPPSTNATISGGSLATVGITGTFTGGANIASSAALAVTIPDASKANAALQLTKGNANSTIKYVKGTQPANDAAYTGTYASGSTNVTVASGDIIWLLVTAENGSAKLYYNITVTVTPAPPPPPPPPPPSGGGGGAPPPETEDEPVVETIVGSITTASVNLAGTDSSGSTTAELSEKSMEKLMNLTEEAEAAGKNATIEIKIATPENTKSIDLSISGDLFEKMADDTDADFTVKTGIGTLTFDADAVEAISAAAGTNDITVSIDLVAAATLPAAAQSQVGNRPVYDFTVDAGGRLISSFGGNPVTVSVPYKLQAGEDPNNVVIYYIADSGVLTVVPNCVYDQASGTVSFITDHFSKYAVSYKTVSFKDVSGWYSGYAGYLSARGIMSGVGGDLFAPDRNLSRAEFVSMLARLSGADLSKYKTASFKDVKTTDWYFGAVEWAYENKLASGYNGTFNPIDNITRQDMAVMLVQYADLIHYQLPQTFAAKVFTDKSKIAPYAADAVTAIQRAGIVTGYPDGRFGPADDATRAEAARIIGTFIEKMFK